MKTSMVSKHIIYTLLFCAASQVLEDEQLCWPHYNTIDIHDHQRDRQPHPLHFNQHQNCGTCAKAFFIKSFNPGPQLTAFHTTSVSSKKPESTAQSPSSSSRSSSETPKPTSSAPASSSSKVPESTSTSPKSSTKTQTSSETPKSSLDSSPFNTSTATKNLEATKEPEACSTTKGFCFPSESAMRGNSDGLIGM
ncbi:hypothetical protein KC345_g7362 [Hortaea werneckii]|nr:hypothetical protein KC345_g7362 [Hortaea werneckii]